MRTSLLTSLFLFCITVNVNAKDYLSGTDLSEGDKQRAAVLIQSNHYLKPKVDQQLISNTLNLNSFLNKLDPYSKYFSSQEMLFKKERNKTIRLGIGLDLLIEDKKILGVPVKDGPAYMVGFTTPMYIKTINNKQIDPTWFNSYQFLTSFTDGQRIEIQTETRNSLMLDKYHVKVKSFKQEHVFIQTMGQFNVLSIRQFSDNSTNEIRKAINSLPTAKPLIIDLRHNPGGDLYATVDTLSFFLENDLTVAYLQERQTSIPLNTISDKDSIEFVTDPKIYLLVSHFTASSAEIFTQAIKHHHPKTTIVGMPTSGKCLAQEIHKLADESAIQLSTYQVLNANKEFCQNKPINIDIPIENIETKPLTRIVSLLQSRY